VRPDLEFDRVDVSRPGRERRLVGVFQDEHPVPFDDAGPEPLRRLGLGDRRLDRHPALFVDDDLEAAGQLRDGLVGDGPDAHRSSLPNVGRFLR
jgi:hypothetical protein